MLNKYDAQNPVNQIKMTNKFVWSNPAHAVASCLGIGQFTNAPGTLGSVAAALLFIVFSPSLSQSTWILLACVLFALGVWSAGKVAEHLGVDDHRGVVIDEFVGMLLVMMCVPQGTIWWILAFVAFRFFDIYKLPPVDMIDEKMKNGFGVMLDDIVAAFYAGIVVWVLAWLFS
ncbi:MAG: phosphatidylglycerophosphatase A [Sutterella sp.]|nr:phosphatidylglycerophosphatase A [Sutterella sp.]